MLTTIKQWFYQKLANHLLRGVKIRHYVVKDKSFTGYFIKGIDWRYTTIEYPEPVVDKNPKYTPKDYTRTESERDAIRKRIQVDSADCRHLKGGRYINDTSFLISKDYNVACFTFVDGSTQIKCLSCRHVWTKDSPDWKEAQRMISNSTNTPNACEQPLGRLVSR